MDTAIVRVDLNSPVRNRKIIPGPRFREHIRSLRILSKRYRLIVLSHQGRKGKKDFMSLRQHWEILRKHIKIKFSRDFRVPEKGNVLLENVRFLDDQSELSFLEDFADLFILDAFSVAHRNEYSVTGFSLPSEPGPLLVKEYNGLVPARKGRFTFVIGGAKPRDVVDAVSRISSPVLLGGVPGMMLSLLRKGGDVEDGEIRRIDKPNVISPVDDVDGKDIGPETINLFKKKIRTNILFAKPMGMYELRKYSRGTREIYRHIAGCRGTKIGGGGNTLDALRKFRIASRNFTYLSLSGGAFLEFVSGGEMPGLRKVGMV